MSDPAVDEVVATAKRLALGRVSGELRRSIRQSLRFDLARGAPNGVGETRFGGEPDLPEGFGWPAWRDRPLIFIGQIAFSDVAATVVAGELPRDGLLSFWYAGANDAWGYDPAESGAARVILHPSDAVLRRRSTPAALSQEVRLASCSWSPRAELTIPPCESSTVERWALGKVERERYFELEDVLGASDHPPIHRLLGHPDPVQGDMQLECQLVTNGLYLGDASSDEDPRRRALEPGALDWRPLLQIDTDEVLGSQWGDGGRVYFWIRQQELAAGRFDGAWHVMQSS